VTGRSDTSFRDGNNPVQGMNDFARESAEDARDEATTAQQVIRVLVAEDSQDEADRIRAMLESNDAALFQLFFTSDIEGALQILQDSVVDAMLLDLTLEEDIGLEALQRAKVAAITVPILVMTNDDDPQQAIRALRDGAQDYVVKERLDGALLGRSILYAVERHRMLNELRAARKREHELATRDPLTKLLNRTSFLEQAERSLAYASRKQRRVAMLYFDLDGFKNVNDTWGHGVGDELLKCIAERVNVTMRRSDFAARVGGDEFVILIHDANVDHSGARVVEHLLESIAKPIRLGQHELWITTSVGVAVWPDDGGTPEQLMRNADTAMYHAKKAGKNRFRYYSHEMDDAVSKRLELEAGLRHAIERDEFSLVYQPQVDAMDGRLIGAEALLRWNFGHRGWIEPSVFIPIAEETGLITEIGEWVAMRACATVQRWDRMGLHLPTVAINVTRRQIHGGGFTDIAIRALRDYDLSPDRLQIELTESGLIQDRAAVTEALGPLRALGIPVAIDDFGTGLSSLTSLREMPVDGMKIDRSFVGSMADDAVARTIVRTVIGLANGLGLRLLAEGVETTLQRDALLRLGCHHMQGFLFSKAISEVEMEAALASREPPWQQHVDGCLEIPDEPER